MIVEYKTRLYGDLADERKTKDKHRTDIYDIQFEKYIDVCCSVMQESIDDRSVVFMGDMYGELPESIGMYFDTESDSRFPIQINFCPFCGKKIEVKEVKRVFIRQKTSEVMALQKKVEEYEEIVDDVVISNVYTVGNISINTSINNKD